MQASDKKKPPLYAEEDIFFGIHCKFIGIILRIIGGYTLIMYYHHTFESHSTYVLIKIIFRGE